MADMSFNVVDFMENNPMSRLSQQYNNRFINKIKEIFTETQQHLFVSSFYCYLNYHPTNDFVVDLDNVWQWLGFHQKYEAKRSLEKNFTIEKDYKTLLRQPAEQKNDSRGGHNKQTFMMNIRTFKLFCIKAGTKKADEIHEYFVKLEALLQDIVMEENNELKNQLENVHIHFDTKLAEEKTKQKQQLLLRTYTSNTYLVYIIRVKTLENGKYIIKIGESRNGIEARYKEHQKNYEECILLDCFAVNKSKQFEQFLHHHDKIRPNKVRDLQGHTHEHELFLIGKELSYDTVLRIVNDNISTFNEWKVNDIVQIIQEENKKLLESIRSPSHCLQNTLIELSSVEPRTDMHQILHSLLYKIENLENTNKQIMEYIQKSSIKTVTNFHTPLVTMGNRLQKLNPDNLTLVKTYESVAECIKESKYDLKRPSIEKAVKENTIYKEFRWVYKNRDEDPNTVDATIPPTREITTPSSGYIAKLNNTKTEILNVYIDRKTACFQNGYESASALDMIFKHGKISRGNYYMLFCDCPNDARQKFIEAHGEPLLYSHGVGQFDAQGNLTRVFVCKYDCIKQLQMSDKTLAKALDKDVLYGEHYYKMIGAKLSML